jgi:hypothetical protein
MGVRNAIKPLKLFIEKMEELRDGVAGALEADLENLIEQAGSLQTEVSVFFDNWEAEEEAADDVSPEGDDDDDEDEDDEDVEEDDLDIEDPT